MFRDGAAVKSHLKKHASGSVDRAHLSRYEKLEQLISKSFGAFSVDPPTAMLSEEALRSNQQEVFIVCLACNHKYQYAAAILNWKALEDHLTSEKHSEIVTMYKRIGYYELPHIQRFSAARELNSKQAMFDIKDKYKDRGIDMRIFQENNTFRCYLMCLNCGKEIGQRENEVVRHLNFRHEIDSKGRKREEVYIDLCRMLMSCKYLILFDNFKKKVTN